MEAPSPMPCRGAAVSAERAVGHTWVASDRELARAATQWRGVIGLDTEFQRVSTFFPIPGLYQVAAASGVWLVDPLAVKDWRPLVEVLTDEDTVKVLHACSEDLELIHRHLAVQPKNLFDTQLAHAFLSENFSFSYANLVESLLDVTLPKHQTRSDWLRRPLSEAQCLYAEEDVAHLLELHGVLLAKLRAAGRWGWFVEDMGHRGRYKPKEPAAYFAGVNKAWQLDAGQLAVLKALCEWREHRAMADDVPRNRVVRDEYLLEFAQRAAIDSGDVRHALPPRVARRFGRELVRAHGEGLERPPEEPLPRPLGKGQRNLLKRLRDFGVERAEELGIAPELLVRRRDLEHCVRRYLAEGVPSQTFLGWRKAVLGDAFLAELGRGP